MTLRLISVTTDAELLPIGNRTSLGPMPHVTPTPCRGWFPIAPVKAEIHFKNGSATRFLATEFDLDPADMERGRGDPPTIHTLSTLPLCRSPRATGASRPRTCPG